MLKTGSDKIIFAALNRMGGELWENAPDHHGAWWIDLQARSHVKVWNPLDWWQVAGSDKSDPFAGVAQSVVKSIQNASPDERVCLVRLTIANEEVWKILLIGKPEPAPDTVSELLKRNKG